MAYNGWEGPVDFTLPWPGPEQQGSTLLHHAHAGVGLTGGITAAIHYLTDEDEG